MKNRKSPSLRQDLSWLKTTNRAYVRQDLLFAFCMACCLMSLATLVLS